MTLQQVRDELRQQSDQEFHRCTIPDSPARIHGISIRELRHWWPIVRPLLARLDRYADGRYSFADIRASLESGKRWLWVNEPDYDCVLLTEIAQHPQMDVLVIFGIAGKLPRSWRGMLVSLEDYARSIGCRQVELYGRKGWQRKLNGYEATRVVLRKQL